MEIGVNKGEAARIESYMEVMRHSPLYDHYYAEDEALLRATLSDALARDALLEATNSRGEVIGLMICEWRGMMGLFPYLALLGVRKDFRGMGVGHRLLETFQRISKELGARNIFICVSAFNPRAKKLYTSFGFKKIALMPDCLKNGISENMLMKRIG